jgi:hypothetical protein
VLSADEGTNTMSSLSDFRKVAREALQAHDALVGLWRNVVASDFAEASPEDVNLLKSLILRRIYPVNAFEVLVSLSPESAIEMLLARYLGKSVDPDKKFGGFEFELESMLDDLCRIAGKEQIANMLNNEQFSIASLDDSRVRRILAEVLELDESQVFAWAESQRKATE